MKYDYERNQRLSKLYQLSKLLKISTDEIIKCNHCNKLYLKYENILLTPIGRRHICKGYKKI